MSDDGEKRKQDLEHRAYELASLRILELDDKPIKGGFDANHLQAVHAYIFQDSPQHHPGLIRDDTAETWIKHRALEGERAVYDVPYVSQGVEARISDVLAHFGGPDTLRDLPPDAAAARIAELYGDLDHAHGFHEGNSRTLREFTRELAGEAGFELDWIGSGVGIQERNALYVARDLAVLERAYPGLTPEKAMQTDDRAEYEASFIMADLKRAVGDKPLSAIIRAGLSPSRERAHDRDAAQPLTANQVLARFGDPSLQARYQAQEQGRDQVQRSASPTPPTAGSVVAQGNTPPEKRTEHDAARDKTAKDFSATRDLDAPGRTRDREKNGGNGGGRGGGGRGGR